MTRKHSISDRVRRHQCTPHATSLVQEARAALQEDDRPMSPCFVKASACSACPRRQRLERSFAWSSASASYRNHIDVHSGRARRKRRSPRRHNGVELSLSNRGSEEESQDTEPRAKAQRGPALKRALLQELDAGLGEQNVARSAPKSWRGPGRGADHLRGAAYVERPLRQKTREPWTQPKSSPRRGLRGQARPQQQERTRTRRRGWASW